MKRERRVTLTWGITLVPIILLIVLVGGALVTRISKGIDDLKYLQMQQRKLTIASQQKQELEHDLNYKLSNEYTIQKSKESLNLTLPGTKIFFIKDPEINQPTIELKTELIFPDPPKPEKPNLEKWIEAFTK